MPRRGHAGECATLDPCASTQSAVLRAHMPFSRGSVSRSKPAVAGTLRAMPWDGDTKPFVKRVRMVAMAGVILGSTAIALSLNGGSRAAGLVLAPSAFGFLAGAAYGRRRGHWPSRTWVLVFIALTTIAIGYAIWLGLYALAHRTIHAVPV